MTVDILNQTFEIKYKDYRYIFTKDGTCVFKISKASSYFTYINYIDTDYLVDSRGLCCLVNFEIYNYMLNNSYKQPNGGLDEIAIRMIDDKGVYDDRIFKEENNEPFVYLKLTSDLTKLLSFYLYPFVKKKTNLVPFDVKRVDVYDYTSLVNPLIEQDQH